MKKCDFCIEATTDGKCPVKNKQNERRVYCEDAIARMMKVLSKQAEAGKIDCTVQEEDLYED